MAGLKGKPDVDGFTPYGFAVKELVSSFLK
jgi:hypothetical protein